MLNPEIILIMAISSAVSAITVALAAYCDAHKARKLTKNTKRSVMGCWSGGPWPPTAPEWKIAGNKVTSLAHFQELTNCNDEVLTALKLKYGKIE